MAISNQAIANGVEGNQLFIEIVEPNIIPIKSTNKRTAFVGEIITYTIVVKNYEAVQVTDVQFSDTLYSQWDYTLVYQVGSFKVDGEQVEPEDEGQTISYLIGSIDPNGQVIITFDVKVVVTQADE